MSRPRKPCGQLVAWPYRGGLTASAVTRQNLLLRTPMLPAGLSRLASRRSNSL